MTLRRSIRGRRALAALATTSVLLLGAAGCGNGDDGGGDSKQSASSAPSGKDGGDESAGESQAPSSTQALATAKDGDITVEITSAVRDAGDFVTVSGTVTNDGGSTWVGTEWKSDERELAGNAGSLSGANLVDSAGKKKYLVLRDTEGGCLCTKFSAVRPGQTVSWFAQFPAPPESAKQVEFQVGGMPPTAVELSGGE
jgi:hypothetical protein